MSRSGRRSLRPLLRLRPFVAPYGGWMALLVAIALLFSVCDAWRAELVKPLIDDVLAGSGRSSAVLRDQVRLATLSDAARAAADAFQPTPPGTDWISSMRRDPLLLGAGSVDPPHEAVDEELTKLLRRSARALLTTADRLPRGDAGAWEQLALAARLQLEALRLAETGAADVAVALSMRSRAVAQETQLRQAVRTLGRIVLTAMLLAALLAGSNFCMTYLAHSLNAKVYVDVQNRLTAHLITLPVGFFETGQRGDLLSRLTLDLAGLSSLVQVALQMLVRSIQVAVLAAWAVKVSGLLAIGLLILALPLLVVLRRFGKRIRRSARRRQAVIGSGFEVMQRMLTGIREVKAFQREDYERERFQEVSYAATEASLEGVRARIASKSLQQFLNDLTVPVLFLAGGWLVMTSAWDLSVGEFGAFLGLVVLMYQPTKIIGQSYNAILDNIPALERVLHLFDQRPEDRPSGPAPSLQRAIELRGVCFAYDGGQEVLRDISFTAPRGSMTALVGRTGSGKSTLMDLVACFRRPTRGQILVDDADLQTLDRDAWLDMLAVVPQESFLFNDTLRENIRYGRLDATDEEVEEAARAAHIHDEICAFERGYDTIAGERGSRLSGGQVQRIAIARAVLKRPEVLILDEATSALDSRTERLVQQALDELAQRATTFVIAHRLSTVRQADQILVLDDGQVLERGRHDELLAQRGVYAALVERQLERSQEPSAAGPQGAREGGAE